MAAESTVPISESAQLSLSPLNNIGPAFAKSLADMPDGKELPPYPIYKLESVSDQKEKIILSLWPRMEGATRRIWE